MRLPGLFGLSWLPLLLLSILALGIYTIPIFDIDFWWHIATARHLIESGTLVDPQDPFGVYTDPDPLRAVTVSGNQWLGQRLLFWTYDWQGADGVVVLRSLVLLGCLLLLYWRCRLADAGTLTTWLMLLMAMQGLRGYQGDRPQLLSFLFVGVMFLLLELYRRDRRLLWLIPLPPLMLLWANSHGGVLLGVALLGLWMGAELVRRWQRDLSDRDVVTPLVVALLAGLAVLVTPVGTQTISAMLALEGSTLQQFTLEYNSPFSLWRNGLQEQQILVWAYYLVATIGLFGLVFSRQFERAALLVVLALVAAQAIRYFPFFLLLAAPAVAVGLEGIRWGGLGTWLKRTGAELYSKLLISGLLVGLLLFHWGQGQLFQYGVEQGRFPETVASYLEQRKASGRIFTTLDWGGYLLWRLDGGVVPYVDSRMLAPERAISYLQMLNATAEGIQAFEQAGFDLAVLPMVMGQGSRHRVKLVDYLRQQPGWFIAHGNPSELLFVRRY